MLQTLKDFLNNIKFPVWVVLTGMATILTLTILSPFGVVSYIASAIIFLIFLFPIIKRLREIQKKGPQYEGYTFDDRIFDMNMIQLLEAYKRGEIERDKALSKRM